MDDIRAIIQDELRQALTGLLPPLVAASSPTVAIPPTVIPPVAANPPVMDAPPANNNNDEGQPLNVIRNVLAVEIKFEDVENYMVEKAKRESLELVQELESKQMQALN